MATLAGDDDLYICKTQRGIMPTFGSLPVTTVGSSKPGFHPIMVGLQEMIPRWDIRTTSPCVLQYYLQTTTFDNSANADLTKSLLQQAAGLWNSVGCGVIFTAATDPTKAHFDVVYSKEENDGATAMAFFPNQVDKVYLYPVAFSDPETKKQLLNSITHELGHVLGLRHEHAAKEGGAVLIGEKNENSIMGYLRKTRSLQQSDRDGLKKFYALQNGTELEHIHVTDFKPQVLKRG